MLQHNVAVPRCPRTGLHHPLARLGAQTDREEGLAVVEEVRALFGLDDSKPSETDEGESK